MQMTKIDLQTRLQKSGFYHGTIDGLFGNMSKQALRDAVTAGPDTPLRRADLLAVSARNSIEIALLDTVFSVEAAGHGFSGARSIVLYEGHIFSKNTNHVYDAGYPDISYPKWDRTKYPSTQFARWEQIIKASALDPDAGLGAASYGAFQILGENYAVCGFDNPYDFVIAMAQTEGAQLQAFISFVTNTKRNGKRLIDYLREHDWADFAAGYNGTAYRENKYDIKLANAYAARPAADKAVATA